MSRHPENHNIMDIPPPVYTNMASNTQNGTSENENSETTQQNQIHSLTSSTSQHYDGPPSRLDFSAPPPYEDYNPDFVKLPTYEEVQMKKRLEGEMSPKLPGRAMRVPPSIGPLPQEIPAKKLTIALTIDAAPNQNVIDNNFLGTDYTFFMAFLIALWFNWIGILVWMFFCRTVADCYGALAGLGLSLAQLAIIVQRNIEMLDLSPENRSNTWLCWLVIVFGFLMSINAVIQYMIIKRKWRLLSVSALKRVNYCIQLN